MKTKFILLILLASFLLISCTSQASSSTPPNGTLANTQFPEIRLGHFLYVLLWAIFGLGVSALALPNAKLIDYKDFLGGTLGISFEALGVELSRGQPALILPLAIGLLLAALVRFLPEDTNLLKITIRNKELKGRAFVSLLFVMFFFVQVTILLLAYRGWWESIILLPG